MFLGLDKQPVVNIAAKDNEGMEISYGQLVDNIKKMQSKMLSRVVAFCLCKNTVGALQGYLSFVEAGVVPLLLSEKIDQELLNNLLRIYEPYYVWLPRETKEIIKGDIIYFFSDYVLIKTEYKSYSIHKDLQLLLATSGSTGSPKLVRYKNGNLESNAKNVAIAFGWTKEERPLCDLGMQYTMGLNVINTHLYVGATLILTTYNLMSGVFWDYVKEEKVTNFTGVPFSYDIMMRLRFMRMDLPYLTTFAEGGGKLTDQRFEELANYAKQEGKRFIATFGTTETAARISILSPELATEKIGSIGMAIPEGELFLIDEDGNVINSIDAEGELCYKGPNVTMGYAICKEDLEKGDEWYGEYHTGDLAKRDKDGCYYITGRKSRFLKLLSYRISLDQCERLIMEKYNVDCACVGTDQKMEIYITDNKDEKNILDYISDKTGLYKTLFKIHIIDKLPRNDTGKVKYSELMKM